MIFESLYRMVLMSNGYGLCFDKFGNAQIFFGNYLKAYDLELI